MLNGYLFGCSGPQVYNLEKYDERREIISQLENENKRLQKQLAVALDALKENDPVKTKIVLDLIGKIE
jgi:cell shape-determining protein MreC